MATLAVPRPVPLQLGHHATTSPFLPMPRSHPAAGNTFHPPKRIVALVRWSRPPFGWCKLNFDGSVKHDGSVRASIGGVIRNSTGHAMVAYAERTEHAGVGVVEARALMRGLELALGMGCSSLVVEGDDLTLVRLLRGESRHTRIPSAMHDDMVRLLARLLPGLSRTCSMCIVRGIRCPDVWTMDSPLPLAVWAKVECDRRGVVYERLRLA